ncbi:MAG: SCO family protein [Candidatus Omnitrophica bacterium]|nr:SCO family protein [Candidatus Omnitrophota bacterium]
MNKSLSKIAVIILAGFVGLALLLNFLNKKQTPPLPVISKLSSFELTDSSNQPFGTKQLQGKIWVAHFLFTTCSGMCPITTGKLASLYRSYKLDKRVEFVSISVNPDNDTSEVLSEFAKKYQADTTQWHFLTGPIEKIQEVSEKILKVGTVDEPVFHSGYFVLIDRHGQIRGYYDGMDQKGTPQLFKDIAVLLKEKS